jgi:dCTP deaminase
MELLDKTALTKSLSDTDPDSLFIEPLLDPAQQIGEVTVDLRLGYDFQVSVTTRKSSIDLGSSDSDRRPIATYFQETRRDLGDRFVLYPHQIVIANTIEYVSLPSDTFADILSRSSYTRLGVHINTMVQPGYRGCITLELFNHGNTPIELIVGCRLVQARFFKCDVSHQYLKYGAERKYLGDVRPTISRAESDHDLSILRRLSKT